MHIIPTICPGNRNKHTTYLNLTTGENVSVIYKNT